MNRRYLADQVLDFEILLNFCFIVGSPGEIPRYALEALSSALLEVSAVL